METFAATGAFEMDRAAYDKARELFDGACFDDEATKATIKAVHDETGLLLDPHSAVGLAAARAKRRDAGVPMIALATAHPAKFPDAVLAATGLRPDLPPHLADLFERDERMDDLPNDLAAMKNYITAKRA